MNIGEQNFNATGWAFVRPAFFAALLAVTVLGLLPQGMQPDAVMLGDKMQHGLAYFVLAALMRLGFAEHRLLNVAGLVLHGALIELAQLGIAGRTGEIGDVFANTLGVASGVLASGLFLVLAAGHLARRDRLSG
jgi:VanZ family protein